uniref:Recoverin 3 n=1 Tax=Sinocyclocheilus anshuiensis TaxID=1608454 RepID=A0A671Q858_9TELE
FKEYVVALHMTSSGKSTLKLEWAFSLFDVDKNGYVTKPEVIELSQAIFNLIPKVKQANLPSDESTPEKRAEKLWAIFDKKDNERVAEGEFIEAVQSNEIALRLIQSFYRVRKFVVHNGGKCKKLTEKTPVTP